MAMTTTETSKAVTTFDVADFILKDALLICWLVLFAVCQSN